MLAMAGLLGGCVMYPGASGTPVREAELLSGVSVFGEEVSQDEIPDVNVLELSPEMHRFLEEHLGEARIPSVRFRRMFRGLSDNGYFTSSYEADTTRTAAETFRGKSGNCLSYTNMFVALAREAGLDARFQIVDVPPSWDGESGFLIRYTHINVLVQGFVFDQRYGEDFSVDFNDVLPDPEYPRAVISDDEATSLFYANQSVAMLRAENIRAAFVYLKKAILLTPDNADLWINLGAFYSKQEAYSQAVGAYEVALSRSPSSRGAMSGLARAHYLVGNLEESEAFSEQVRRYRERNPFYHYAVAQTEYERGQYDAALEAINEALELKYRVGRFHFMKGLTEYKLGELAAAESSFDRAQRYGNFRDLKKRYLNGVADARPFG